MRSLPLADEYFLVSHDEYSGKTLASIEVIETGLAGAVVGELALSGRIAIAENGLVTVADDRPHRDRVTDAALGEMLRQQMAHSVRSWVEYLRSEARAIVAPRLVQAGLIEKKQVRSLLRHTIRYPAVDPLKAASPRARLYYLLSRPENLDALTALLGGLILATGLEGQITTAGVKETRVKFAAMLEFLSYDLRAVCSGVDDAIAALALTVRR